MENEMRPERIRKEYWAGYVDEDRIVWKHRNITQFFESQGLEWERSVKPYIGRCDIFAPCGNCGEYGLPFTAASRSTLVNLAHKVWHGQGRCMPCYVNEKEAAVATYRREGWVRGATKTTVVETGVNMTLDEYRKSVLSPEEYANAKPLGERSTQFWNRIHQDSIARHITRSTIKEEAVALKGGCCQRCGYNKNLRALEFHHVNPQDKAFAISEVTWGMKADDGCQAWRAVQVELEKCILLCANCHREVESEKDAESAAWMQRVLDLEIKPEYAYQDKSIQKITKDRTPSFPPTFAVQHEQGERVPLESAS
jgi:5-methylcytosine-specific restriction endonuclease McrA